MINSRNKGSKNERDVAKLFQKWTGYEFARTPQSGGLHWKKAHTTGDIVCIDELHGFRFAFSIECKFHSEIELLHLIDGSIGKKTNKVLEFWKQCQRDATVAKKLPVLFMRKNGMKSDMHFVAFSTDFFALILMNITTPFKHGIIHCNVDGYQFTFINSLDLFEQDYKTFHRTAKRLLKHATHQEN